MFDDLFSGLSDFFSGAYSTATSALGAIGTALADLPSIAQGAAQSVMPGMFGASDTASASPTTSLLLGDGVGSASADGGFAAPAAAAAREDASFAPDPMREIFGAEQDPMIAALSRSPQSSMVDQMISDASRSATSMPAATGNSSGGLVQSVLDWTKANPMAAATAAGVIKGAFAPSPIEIARAKAKAEAEAKMQLAQWLKDNNRAGGVGVSLNMRPTAAPGAVQRIVGGPVYTSGSPVPGFINSAMRGA